MSVPHVSPIPMRLALLLVLTTAAAQAQPTFSTPRFTLASPDEELQSLFGAPLEAVGDLDGDGVPDLIGSAPDETARLAGGATVNDAGQIHAFSGATGAFIRTYVSPNPEEDAYFANAVLDMGDRDGDGVSDFLASASREAFQGSTNVGRVYLISGATGAEIASFRAPTPVLDAEFGFDLARLGDLNGDGTPEVGVASHLERVNGLASAGRLYVVDGASFETLYTLQAPAPQQDGVFGYTSSNAGDIDGDGVDDIVTGEPGRDRGALQLVGRAYLFSGATGALVRAVETPTVTQLGFFGRWVAGLDDVDGDGVPDFATGANGEPVQGAYLGRAYVISGATGEPIRTLVSPDEQEIGFFGEIVEAVPDLDSDGRRDVMVSARAEDDARIAQGGLIGRVYLFSSVTGALLATLKPPAPDPDGVQYFGYLTASLGDLDGDGFPEIGVGAWGDNPDGSPAFAGRAYVYSGAFAVAAEAPPDAETRTLSVSPNPARDAATVRLAVPARLVVLDVLGRVVLRRDAPAGETRLDVSGLAPGVYTVVAHDAAGGVTEARITIAR